MILLLLLLFRLQASTAAQDDDSLPSDRLWCRLPPPEKPKPELTTVEEPTPKYNSSKPNDYKPYRILFVYDQDMSKANRLLLEEAGKAANDRFSPMVKAPVLSDIRLPRQWNKTSQACQRPQCSNRVGEYIPDEYALPCRDPSTKKIVQGDNTTEQPSWDVARLNKQGYSLVVYVFVNGDGADIASCGSTTTVAFAEICRADPASNRPTHGVYIWCQTPNTVSKAERNSVMLHESLHIVTGESLIGVGSALCPVKNLTEGLGDGEDFFPNQCKDKVWKLLNMPWKDANGKDISFRAHIAITPFVKQAAQKHFECKTIEGAELETFATRPNETVWAIGSPNTGHWSYRLFSDEILSPFINPSMRLSNFTLGALKDSGWYEVDLSNAELLVISVPKENACATATKNCQEIINDARARPKSLNFIAPYCDDNLAHPNQIVSPRCSNDGSTILFCNSREMQSQYCPVVVSWPAKSATANLSYDDMVCEKATFQPANAIAVGGQVGKTTMCATFTSLPKWPGKEKKMIPICLPKQCQMDAIVFFLNSEGFRCEFKCTKAMSNTVNDFDQTNIICKEKLGDKVSLICPDFDTVCPRKPTLPPPGTNLNCETGVSYQDENDFVPGEYVAPDPTTFVPYKILFVFDPNMNPKNRNLLEQTGKDFNKYLASFLKAPILNEVRRARKWNATTSKCNPATCYGQTIPNEFVLPCYDKNNKLVDEKDIPNVPTSTIQKHNQASYTLVVFAVAHEDLENRTFFASASPCQLDPLTRRPTHGVYIWYRNPSEISAEVLAYYVLHEGLHIVTGKTFIGAGLPAFDCTDPTETWPSRCWGITWRAIKQPWIDQHGKETTRTSYFVITPHVKKAVQDHFKCATIGGAELPVYQKNGSDCVDQAHWNMRLFSDDILASWSIGQRLSSLSFAVLKDSGWYEVDTSKAQSLVISRPRGLWESCDAGTKSCHELLNNSREDDGKAKLIEPFCDKTDSIISSRCSMDGKRMLVCDGGDIHFTDFCDIAISPTIPQHRGYDTPVCEEATTQPLNATTVGGKVGAGTICVTFTNIPKWPDTDKPKLYPLCVEHKCDYDAKIVRLLMKPSGVNFTCTFECTKNIANEKEHFKPQPYSECKQVLGVLVSLICPDFYMVCTSKTTTLTPTIPTPEPHIYKSCREISGPAYQDENDFTPTKNYVAPDLKSFVPYKILFLYDPRMSNTSSAILEKAGKHLNKYLATFLSAPRLHEVRRARKWNETIGKCNPATCRGLKVPTSYVLPCSNKEKQLNPEDNVEANQTLEISKYNEANYTLVAYVYLHKDPENIFQCLEHSYFGASASGAAFCQADPVTRRPTHAVFIWCHQPSNIAVEKLTYFFLHEALHIITGGSFIGSGVRALGCTDLNETFPTRCEGNTFKFVNQSWTDQKGVITTRTTCIAITPYVKKAAQDHFNCSTVEGAEVRVVDDGNGSVCVDQRHWNMRLFSDELMTPQEGTDKRLSVFTLAALKDTEWYEVDVDEAAPLVISRPRGLESCDAATKSCHEILNNSRHSDTKLAQLIEPYCDNHHKIISSRCSSDGTRMLSCSLAATGDCHILFADSDESKLRGYDSTVCKKATKQSSFADSMGGNIGKETMCATLTVDLNLSNEVQPICALYQCLNDSVLLVLTLTKGTCRYSCERDMANKLIKPDENVECKQARTSQIHLICPDFDQVCPFLQMTTEATIKTTPPSPGQSTSSRGKPDMTSKPSGPVTTKPPATGSTAGDDPQHGPTPGQSGSPGIKHDSKCIAIILFMGVVFAKVWFQIF